MGKGYHVLGKCRWINSGKRKSVDACRQCTAFTGGSNPVTLYRNNRKIKPSAIKQGCWSAAARPIKKSGGSECILF